MIATNPGSTVKPAKSLKKPQITNGFVSRNKNAVSSPAESFQIASPNTSPMKKGRQANFSAKNSAAEVPLFIDDAPTSVIDEQQPAGTVAHLNSSQRLSYLKTPSIIRETKKKSKKLHRR